MRGLQVNDPSGDIAERELRNLGHNVVIRKILPDEVSRIRDEIRRLIDDSKIDIIITIGGTGLTSDDVTIEAVTPLLDKILPGFGEIFRYLSYREVGSLAILSRAIAGISRDKVIFCLPGSVNAVKLAINMLIGPLLPHLLYLLKLRD
ncbi:MAG: molybdenum cofactor biosynthesis protein [Thermofilum sp. ex4484_15]|nr:MAG: molybdenum cofactor biosynthesis protein [Thermofilum sp. ex4484_15]